MRKTAILILCGILLIGTLAGCAKNTPAPTAATTQELKPATPSPVPVTTASPSPTATESPASTATPQDAAAFEALRVLLPGEEGNDWKYFGTGEYAQTMHLDSVHIEGQQATYEVSGEVTDMSGGASNRDFSFKLTYTISGGSLRQHSTGDMLMDSPLPDVELLRTPLDQGAVWTQTARNAAGGDVDLDCKITAVTRTDGRDEYTVEYRAKDGSIFERRKIARGLGITSFERSLNGADDPNVIGYNLQIKQ